MNLVIWLVFGFIVGLGGFLVATNRDENQLLRSFVFGIGGALLGGLFASSFLGSTLEGFTFSSMMLAVCGSLALFVTAKALRKI